MAALTKLVQVMPSALRERVDTLGEVTVRHRPRRPGGPTATRRPTSAILMALAQACRREDRLRFDYRTGDDRTSRRHVEPHRLVSLRNRWYLVAFDLDRDDWRTFRVDRVGPPGRDRLPAASTARRPTPPRSSPRASPCGSTSIQARVRFPVPPAVVAREIAPTVGVIEPDRADATTHGRRDRRRRRLDRPLPGRPAVPVRGPRPAEVRHEVAAHARRLLALRRRAGASDRVRSRCRGGGRARRPTAGRSTTRRTRRADGSSAREPQRRRCGGSRGTGRGPGGRLGRAQVHTDGRRPRRRVDERGAVVLRQGVEQRRRSGPGRVRSSGGMPTAAAMPEVPELARVARRGATRAWPRPARRRASGVQNSTQVGEHRRDRRRPSVGRDALGEVAPRAASSTSGCRPTSPRRPASMRRTQPRPSRCSTRAPVAGGEVHGRRLVLPGAVEAHQRGRAPPTMRATNDERPSASRRTTSSGTSATSTSSSGPTAGRRIASGVASSAP